MLSIIEIKSEIGAGTRGASLGPDAIKIASLNMGKNLFFKYRPQQILDENYLLFNPVTTPYGKRISGLVRVYDRVAKAVSSLSERKDLLVIMAGDHSTAGGTIAGLRIAYPNKKLGVIWIDAHADLHSPYSTPSGNLHGMPLGTALGFDNMENKINEIKKETAEGWEKLKNIGGILPKITPQDLVFIGVRDTEKAEEDVITHHKIRNFTVGELRQKGPQKIIEETLDYLSHCDLLYVSFDVDCLDPSISRGTGTPVENGFFVEEADALVQGFVSQKKTICFEVVEVNPCLDDKVNTMAEVAFGILENVVSTFEKRKEE
jgi:arginase